MAEELHVYLLFCTDRVVASSEAEAFEIWQALMGENPDDYDLEIERVPDDARWRITSATHGAPNPVQGFPCGNVIKGAHVPRTGDTVSKTACGGFDSLRAC